MTFGCSPKPTSLDLSPVITKDEALRVDRFSMSLSEYQALRSRFPALNLKDFRDFCEFRLVILYQASRRSLPLTEADLEFLSQILVSSEKSDEILQSHLVHSLFDASDLPRDKSAFLRKLTSIKARVKIQAGPVFLSEKR